MIRILYFLFTYLFLAMVAPFLQTDPVFVKVHAPEQVKPGDSFLVEITIDKGTTMGFARIQQTLPAGCTADVNESNEGQFLFEDNTVKFIWTGLPDDHRFTVSYTVHTDAAYTGPLNITGLFTFVRNKKTERIELDPLNIFAGEQPVADVGKVQVDRTITADHNGLYRVALHIHGALPVGAGRFVDHLPAGCIATVAEGGNSRFSFDGKDAVFNWSQLPQSGAFDISYTVQSSDPAKAPVIEGMFVYGNDPALTAATATVPDADQQADQIIQSLVKNEEEKMHSTAGAVQKVSGQGVFYQVQIAATRKSPVRDTQWFHDHYRIGQQVDLGYHEGWRKYTIGRFESYKSAEAFGKATRQLVTDAFVVAYDNGTRIPVRDALQKKPVNQ